MPITRAGPFDIDYEDVGLGPAVVLLHSSASGNRQWRRLTDELKDRYRLIAVNLFGYGATTPWAATEELALGDAADLVATVADRVGEPIALDGWSAIAAPTHLIGAADSRAPTWTIAALLAEANPSWRLHDIACGGHMAPLARPDVVNPLIAQLLDEALM